MTRRLVVTGFSLMTDNIWTAYIHTDRDSNEQLLLKDTVMLAKSDGSQEGLITDGSLVY